MDPARPWGRVRDDESIAVANSPFVLSASPSGEQSKDERTSRCREQLSVRPSIRAAVRPAQDEWN
jgi:hypothetical protein